MIYNYHNHCWAKFIVHFAAQRVINFLDYRLDRDTDLEEGKKMDSRIVMVSSLPLSRP